MAEEGVEIPGEGTEGTSMSPEIQDQKVKDAARQKGWKPLKEWDGDPEDWVSAKEFVGREKLFKKIHDLQYSLGQQSKKQSEDLAQIKEHFAKVRETEYKRAVAELKAEKREALANQDVDAAERIEERMDALKDEQTQVKQQVATSSNAQPTQEFVDWQGRNKWFNSDTDMTQVATELGVSHAMANPSKPQTAILEYVEKRIKQMYPEKFGTKTRTPSPVDGGGNSRMTDSSGTNKKGKLTTADLDDTERHVLSTLLKTKTLKIMAEKNKRSETDEYLTQLAEAKGLR